jgi:hypothetical protein
MIGSAHGFTDGNVEINSISRPTPRPQTDYRPESWDAFTGYPTACWFTEIAMHLLRPCALRGRFTNLRRTALFAQSSISLSKASPAGRVPPFWVNPKPRIRRVHLCLAGRIRARTLSAEQPNLLNGRLTAIAPVIHRGFPYPSLSKYRAINRWERQDTANLSLRLRLHISLTPPSNVSIHARARAQTGRSHDGCLEVWRLSAS